MGVAASYYAPLARALSGRGFDVLVAENRGTGTSELRARRGVDFGWHEMLHVDLPAALEVARRRLRGSVHGLGHSLGGQLAALYLATNPGAFDRVILVGCGAVGYRSYAVPARWRVLAISQLCALVASVLGYFPGDKLGFGGVQPVSMMRDWARQARTGTYHPRGSGPGVDYEGALARLRARVLAIHFEGDTIATATSVDVFCGKLASAEVVRRHVALEPGRGDPHFRWLKQPANVVAEIASYL
jgi:predicted alpha/beta hydrolase